jgi:hypothetical protein
MSRIRTALVATVAAGLMLMTANAASAGQLQQGSWTLTAPGGQSTTYTAQIQQPINPDGTSVWPAKRGVVPVQFKVDKTEKSGFVFESVCSDTATDTDASFVGYTPPASTPPMKVKDIRQLIASFDYTTGQSIGGSLRWSIRVSPTQSIWVYYGDAPNWTGEGGSGVNLWDATDNRFDTSQLAPGTQYNTKANVLAQWGELDVMRISLVVDSCWAQDQILDLDSASVNGDTFTFPEPADASYQSNEAPAKIKVVKLDNTPDGQNVTELLSSAQGDTSGWFRQIDGKYMYNLKLDGLTAGTYRVYIDVNSDNTTEGYGQFNLK